LRSRDIRLLDVEPDQNVLAYIRPDQKISNSILVILNYGMQAGAVRLNDAFKLPEGGKFLDLLSGDEIAPENATIAIPGRTVRILKPD
jgi:hypothetical protein